MYMEKRELLPGCPARDFFMCLTSGWWKVISLECRCWSCMFLNLYIWLLLFSCFLRVFLASFAVFFLRFLLLPPVRSVDDFFQFLFFSAIRCGTK